jgi:hypothetical protein
VALASCVLLTLRPRGIVEWLGAITTPEAMKYPLILGCTAALVFCANPAIAKSPAEIEKIVRSVSVEIQVVGQDRVGSGSIASG